MKCSKEGCGLPGQGNFCQSCGSKMMPDIPDATFIVCSGKLNDLPCGADIVPLQNFCTKCGAKVDQSLFGVALEACKKCGTFLSPECLFCAQCGEQGTGEFLEINGKGNASDNNVGVESMPETVPQVSPGGDNKQQDTFDISNNIDSEEKVEKSDVHLKKAVPEYVNCQPVCSLDNEASVKDGDFPQATDSVATNDDTGVDTLSAAKFGAQLTEKVKQEDNVTSDDIKRESVDNHPSEHEQINLKSSYTEQNMSRSVTGEADENANFPCNEIVPQLSESVHSKNEQDEESCLFDNDEIVADTDDMNKSFTQKRKHGGGGGKMRSVKKRERKKRNHPERYGLTAEQVQIIQSRVPKNERIRKETKSLLKKYLGSTQIDAKDELLRGASETDCLIEENKRILKGDLSVEQSGQAAVNIQTVDHLKEALKTCISEEQVITPAPSLSEMSARAGQDLSAEHSKGLYETDDTVEQNKKKAADLLVPENQSRKVATLTLADKDIGLQTSLAIKDGKDNNVCTNTESAQPQNQNGVSDNQTGSVCKTQVFGECSADKLNNFTASDAGDVIFPPSIPSFFKPLASDLSDANDTGIPPHEFMETENTPDLNTDTENIGKENPNVIEETEGDLEDNDVVMETEEQSDKQADPEKTKENKNAQNQTSMTGKKAKNKNTLQGMSSSDGKVTVRFHVLVSTDFNLGTDDKVVLRIDLSDYGGWANTKHILKNVGQVEDYMEMQIDLRISQYDLRRYRKYKYVVVRADPKKKFIYENYHVHNKKDKHNNRLLYIPDTFTSRNEDMLHQYDGIVFPKPHDNIFKRGIDWARGKYEKDCQKHAEKFAKAFCPAWFMSADENATEDVSIKECVTRFECLVFGLRKAYFTDIGCWDEEKDFKKMVCGSILSPVITQLQTKEYSSGTYNIAFLKALTIALACERTKLVLPMEELQIICKCLLVHSSDTIAEYVEMEIVKQTFPDIKVLVQPLKYLIECVTAKGKNPAWMFCLPLFHFISGICDPYDSAKKENTHSERDPHWWGTFEIIRSVRMFKASNEKWDLPFSEILECMKPLFEMDYYLPRSILASLQLNELSTVLEHNTIPAEICCAGIFFFQRVTTSYLLTVSQEHKTLEECKKKLLGELQQYFPPDRHSKEQLENEVLHWWLAYKVSLDMAKEAFDRCKTSESVIYAAHIFLHCVSVYEQLTETENSQQQLDHITEVCNFQNRMQTWMENNYGHSWYTNMEMNFQNWNLLFVDELQSENVRNIWNDHFRERLSSIVMRQINSNSMRMSSLVQLYCQKNSSYKVSMQKCMSTVAFKAIEKGYDIDVGGFLSAGKKAFGELLSTMFLKNWEQICPRDKEEQVGKILTFALTFCPFEHFVRKFYVDTTLKGILSIDCQNKLSYAVDVIKSCVDALSTGVINIGVLRKLQEKEEMFSQIVQEIFPQEKEKKEWILKALCVRMKEVNAFLQQAKQMAFLMELCQHIGPTVDTYDVDTVLKKSHEVEQHVLTEFCKPCSIGEEFELGKFVPVLSAFSMSDKCLECLPVLEQFERSSVFMKFWCERCENRQQRCMSVDDVIEVVWIPVSHNIRRFVNDVKKGTLVFQQLELVVGKMFGDDYETMAAELQVLGVDGKIAKRRIQNLKQYRRLKCCVKGARVILDFAKEYELQEDFQPIRDIASHHNKSFRISSFDGALMETCAFLEELTTKRANCLKAFVQSVKLVKWLQETMSGVKELKVFVDLASISAGDEPINIKKVKCLHSAVTGYAPLIFDLKHNSGYVELLQVCKIVWKELDANEHLPDQLVDTCHELEWLKDVKKAHVSVEVTSLVQADAINDCGIYSVGKAVLKDIEKETLDGAFYLTAGKAMRLTVREKPGETQAKCYNFTQLQDLQSRLMLVAGKAEKGNVSVERFTMIFDGITRLCNVYVKLCEAGCVLYKDWSARCLCGPTRPVPLLLKFGHGNDIPAVECRTSNSEDLKDLIPFLANFMENCLKEWLQHIKMMRRKFIHLNYFTVDQLVILQRELMKVGTDEQPTHLIYPLLSAVKENCSPDDIIDAMSAAKNEINNQEVLDADYTDDENQREDTMCDIETTMEEKQQNFIQELVQAGCSEVLAIKALEHVKPEEITQGIYWCMENEDGDISDTVSENITDTGIPSRLNAEKTQFTGWGQTETSVQSVINSSISKQRSDEGVTPFIHNLSHLWKQFLESISSTLQDYLSLEHLGIILSHLSGKDRRTFDRTLLPGFVENQPNLIICKSGDVLLNTLSFYMRDEDQPLPQADEILMCTAKTSKDEVDIFWRRAIFEGGRKIHSLVYADLLDFDVSEAAAQSLEEYLQEVYHSTENHFRLLVICSSDNEYRSSIVSFLDKFRRPTLPVKKTFLQGYIASKLSIEQQTISGIRPGAHVDSNRSTMRVVKSWRAGVGKTLYKQRKFEELMFLNETVTTKAVSIPLYEKNIDIHAVTHRLLQHTRQPGELAVSLFHFDIAHEVQNGVDYLLFNLVILGCLTDNKGFVWRKLPTDIYLVEAMPLLVKATGHQVELSRYVHPMLDVLPDVVCRSPPECLLIYSGARTELDFKETDQLFDEKQFRSPLFQRPFQYLLQLENGRQHREIRPGRPNGNRGQCLQVLLSHCGIQDPSWSELHHFVWFLNTQLEDFEQNNFVSAAAAEDLPGFSEFVLQFLIQMSRDFSTRSLNMSEQSPGQMQVQLENELEEITAAARIGNDKDLKQYEMRRTWESSPHPYLFFNSDRFTFTFLGFFIDRATGNLIDQQTGRVLVQEIMSRKLYDSLVKNHAPMQENFDDLQRDRKIMKLCNVMGIEFPHDPDDTYELTTDNVKKILAIYMRFRCNIPVIIMGETGCGKTRLIKFMCSLQMPPGLPATNMILMKVHGGTTKQDIIRKVNEAEKIAKKNRKRHGTNMYTVLFFDEANTTEAIGLIKEIMCDRSLEGEELKLCENLKMVAACNPYRKHSDELIKKLEQAGLGYHVDADETTDRLGRLPMRRLVYRVQPLPQSLLPLVWDFGQLKTDVEDLYIRQMVRRYIREERLPNILGLVKVLSTILTVSQYHMRAQNDECSFVSLRDVDRVLTVMSWFYEKSEKERTLFNLMDEKLYNTIHRPQSEEDTEEESEEENTSDNGDRIEDITRSLILALGVCYHSCLKNRQGYRDFIAQYFKAPCKITGGAEQIRIEIESCQDVFLDHVHLEKNIARNMALKENVFMMAVCIELRIPLFLVGKPGSSKSLAKTIVSDAMQGNTSKKKLFKEMKQAQMVSFQCSPLSTPDGIVKTFRQCAQFQKDKDLDTFVSIVVLDEVGLAEDSPRMPLKTLHPLLEDGCQGDEMPEEYMKVAFIGISNWALDPAKMNRGILVQREVPDLEELKLSAVGICQSSDQIGYLIKPLIEPMADSYLDVFKKASDEMREFFGLRDFYSLVKMVFRFVEKSKQKPTWHEMVHAIKRNFGGLDQVDPVKTFRKNLTTIPYEAEPKPTDPDCSPSGLIQACLFDTNNMHSESRYLLLLTENYGALTIIQQLIMSRGGDIRPVVIFGSSFRSDQEYTQVCRNINKIKICMETGNTVVLLNLENLYESLYDALNQYYVYFGGERYVDLGLGTHRVKCPVHKKFRLIVVAEKQTVYDKFPIPLINRLEKHFLTTNTMLTAEQQDLVSKLEDWTKQYVIQKGARVLPRLKTSNTRVGDVFIGYHDDTCSAVILHIFETMGRTGNNQDRENQVLIKAKMVLLWCATPDSVLRLKNSSLPDEEKEILENVYHSDQAHENLMQYLNLRIMQEKCEGLFAQITTHSKLLASVHKTEISTATGIPEDQILLLESLSSFDTEQQFSGRIHQHLLHTNTDPSLIVIQCDSGDTNINLVASARYCVLDELEKMRDDIREPVHVVFTIQLPRKAVFQGFQCGVWHSVHIDDLFPEDKHMLTIKEMKGKSVANLFTEAVDDTVMKEVDNEFLERNNQAEFDDTEEDKSSHAAVHSSPTKQELQVSDVIIELCNTGQERKQHLQSRFNMKELILSCVQAALSHVKDKVENSKRETDRVALLLKLLHNENEGDRSFLHGVCCLIAKLLKEKETKTYSTYLAQDWLVNEAADLDNISKTGTFRRCCSQTLESKVSPIFAGVIAFLDTNNNLSILQDDDSSWKKELWLTFLNAPEALNLEYTDLLSPKRQIDLKEVIVMTTGCEGHLFSSRLPFSWLLFNKVSEVLKLHMPVKAVPENDREELAAKREIFVQALMSLPLCEVLVGKLEKNTYEEVVAEYIHDFVHCVYHAGTEDEHRFVCQTIHSAACNMLDRPDWASLLNVLVCIHLAYQTLASRLTYFRAMNSVWPECSTAIMQMKAKNPDHFMFSGEDFIFCGVCLLIENLAPIKVELDQQVGRAAWLNKVHQYRPVVEKLISTQNENEKPDGAQTVQSVNRAKQLWSRITIVKLFLEHVCTPGKKDKISIKYCMPLWKILEEDTDLKEIGSFEGVEKFLKLCNRSAIKEYIGTEVKCSQCDTVVEGPPIKLPCSDVLCDECHEDMKALGEYDCPKCNQHFEKGLHLKRQTVNDDAFNKLKDYQKRCNTFFMDVVSQLCFADNTAPSPAVVNKLLRYIFFTTRKDHQRTKDLSVFGTGIDPTPVFRSFLLQLLIKTSEETVKEHLESYLREAESLIRRDDQNQEEHYIELSLLVIQCLEDMFIQRVNIEPNLHQYVARALHTARQTIEAQDQSVEKLYGIAYARMGLAETAKLVAYIVLNQVEPRAVLPRERKVIEAAQILCEDTDIKGTRIYLVKCICRCYGIDVYQKICCIPFLRWIPITDMKRKQVVEVCDRYIVCGEEYIKIRESLTKVALGENIELLEETVQELLAAGKRVEPLLQLAMHREITGSYLYPNAQRKITPQVLEKLDGFIDNSKAAKNKDFGHALIHNRLSPVHLENEEGDELRTQGIKCLIVHFMSTMSHLKGDKTLLQPLILLMKKPQKLANAFLPTMPQDDLQDVREVLLAARNHTPGADNNPVFYRCPNGHPYVIGDCGRPAVVGNCKDCGAAIGGQGHQLRPGNVKVHGGDNTMAGHILGHSEDRGKGMVTERNLTPVQCSTIRLILHMAMYIGSSCNPQGVCSLINPAIEVTEVEMFLWRHIVRDVEDIHHSLGRSVDDVLLCAHNIMDSIMRTHDEGEHVRGELSGLSSKRGRNQWETEFSASYLQATLQDIENVLKTHNQRLAKDKRLGADPLLCLLYETDTAPLNETKDALHNAPNKPPSIPRLWSYKTPTSDFEQQALLKTRKMDNENVIEIQKIPRVWRYRTPVSLQHLKQELDAKIGGGQQADIQFKVLQLFLKEEHNLRALRYVPSILRLHRTLLHKFQKKLDKAEAAQITVGQLKKDRVLGFDTEIVLQDFADAWELVRNSLQYYLCPTELGGMMVPKEHCLKSINDKTTLAILLPTAKEGGLCSYALLDFLMRKQNDFLNSYLKETHRDMSSVTSISPNEVTSAHLISYVPQRDILPLILANCQYSFEMGKGTKIEYDFAGLERQLMDRFLFAKSRLDVGRVLQVDMMVYRTEFTTATVFKNLSDKIPQECLSAAEKTQICSDFKSLPETCQSLDNLDIAISFLKTTGGKPDQNIHEFMVNTLQMESSLQSQKAQQVCQFQHAQSLWLLLSLLKSKKMTDSQQHSMSIFENVGQEFHEELPKELVTALRVFMRRLTVEKQSLLVEVLHEFILLVVSERQNRDDEEFLNTTENRLVEWLPGYVEGLDSPTFDVTALADFPRDILYKHSILAWISAYKNLRENSARSSRRT